jgi:hypothetical protein
MTILFLVYSFLRLTIWTQRNSSYTERLTVLTAVSFLLKAKLSSEESYHGATGVRD